MAPAAFQAVSRDERTTTVIIHPDSHTEHITPEVLAFVMGRFGARTEPFFLETVELPSGLSAECALYGPAMGDPPVAEEEVTYVKRPHRPTHPSRICIGRPARQTRILTVIGGAYQGHECVLYTAHGGPPAPREPGDPSLDDRGLAESEVFWKDHALAF
jgi:hypothetical protein